MSKILPSNEYEKKLQQIDDAAEKLKQPVSEFPLPFACVPWGHHVRIVQHSESVEEALFYVSYTIKEGVSRNVLERVMKDNLYNKLGKAPNNFPQHLTPQLAQLAQQVVKENYDFGSDMNRADVQWSFKGIQTPMGVATYNNIRIKDMLPSKELLAERVRLLQKELQETKRLMNKNK